MTRLGVVTGLVAEAACVRRAAARLPEGERPLVFSAGQSAERARGGARHLITEGAGALLSFGVAGGLAPHLGPGTVVLADAVVCPDGRRIAADSAWLRRFEERARATCSLTVATVAGADDIVTSAADKRHRFEATGAAIVDMESHGVAAAAAAAGVPFLALRAVVDPAHRAIPWTALDAVAADGRRRVLHVVGRLVARPWEVFPLLRLALDDRAAMLALSRVAALDPGAFALL